MRVRWSESEARKPYARPFMVTFVSDDGTDVGSVALNGADLLYYTHFQTAVLSLDGRALHRLRRRGGSPTRSARGSTASPALIPPLGEITMTPRSSFDEHQGRVFRLTVTAGGQHGERRMRRPARVPGLPGGARPSDRLALPRRRDRGCRRRRRAAARLERGAITRLVEPPGCRRGDERDLAVGVSGTAYERAVATLDAVAWRGIMPGLERTRALLAALGNPQTGLRGALVAGTNGKGSVCATVDSVCRAAGHRTVLLTSPHLQSYCERIVRDGVADHRDRVRGAGRHRASRLPRRCPTELQPTGFEVLTAGGDPRGARGRRGGARLRGRVSAAGSTAPTSSTSASRSSPTSRSTIRICSARRSPRSRGRRRRSSSRATAR